jgi:Protein of unknown function (DUF3562)
MSDKSSHPQKLAAAQSVAEQLANETNTPIEQVAEIYASESAELERTARIKTFIGVLATRRTRNKLNARSAR